LNYILSAGEFLAIRCACLMADRSFFVEVKVKKRRCRNRQYDFSTPPPVKSAQVKQLI